MPGLRERNASPANNTTSASRVTREGDHAVKPGQEIHHATIEPGLGIKAGRSSPS